jgi:hypothetical protein
MMKRTNVGSLPVLYRCDSYHTQSQEYHLWEMSFHCLFSLSICRDIGPARDGIAARVFWVI